MNPTTNVSVARPVTRRLYAEVVKNITSTWASLLANVLVSFFLTPLIVGSLGNVYYGIWALVTQFTGYLWLFDFGVRESVIKYVAQYHASGEREELSSTVQGAVSLYVWIGLAALTGTGLMALALPHLFNIPAEAVGTARLTLLITGATIAQGFVFNVFVGVLMGLQRFYLVARTGILFTLVRAALILLALSTGYGIVALALIHFFLSLAMSVIIVRFALRELPYLAPRLVRPEPRQVAKIVAFSKYVFVTNVGEKVVYLTDSLVIGAFLPISTLTFYAIPASLVTYLKSFIGAMGVVVNPMSSSLEAASDDSRLRLLFLTASKAAVVLGLPVCVGFVVLGERFIDIWMGSGFGSTSGPVLIVLATTHFIGLPHHTISGVLYGLGRHRITAVTRVCEAAANLALSVILVQQYGLIGVALGTLIPHAVALGLVLPAATGRVLSVPLRTYYASTYVRPLAASIPFILTCGLIDRVLRPTTLATFLAAVCVGLTTYVVPCWVIALSEGERRSARQRLGRLAWR